jgi:hypothetical protein
VDLDEILYGDVDIEVDLDYILLNLIASTFPKWRTFKLFRWAKFLNRWVDLDEILYGGDCTEYVGYPESNFRFHVELELVGAARRGCTAV